MADTYKITQLAVYNPQRLDDKTFIDLFITRTKVFAYLLSQLKDEETNSIAQHHLIIGARGMGKTMLLKRIEIELKSTELKKRFIPILYPEEQYNITGLDDLWLNSLDKVADVMDYLRNDKLVNKIDIKVDALQANKNKEGHEDEAYDFFIKITTELGKRPVLLIDNINLIFKRLDKNDQHRLRNLLSKKNAPIIIAASPVKVQDALDYGAPFYDAFQIQYLQKLNDDELLRILNNLAELTGNKEIIPELRQKISRIKVINQLTGGIPRTSVMLFKLISRGFSNSIIDDLDALLDDITPLYKARFEEELSDQLQTILNAIAINWDPLSIEKLRTLTGLSNSKLSPQLKRLTESGWIVNKPGYKTKGKVYEVSERFFNIWYLMRQSSRRHKRQVLYLSRFLESIYGEEIKTGANRLLTLPSTKSDHILYNLAVAECLSEEDLKKQLIDKCREDLVRMKDIRPELKKEFESILKHYEGTKEKSKEELSKSLDQLETKIEHPSILLANIALLEKKYEKSEKILKELLQIDKQDAEAWFQLAYLYQVHLNRFEESAKCYKECLKINSNDADAWNNLGNLYQDHLSNYKEAEKCYKKAIGIDPRYAYAWNGLANLYQEYLNNYKESEKCYKKAIGIDPKNANPWNGLANLYQEYLNNCKESEKCYKKALEIDPRYAYAWNGLANLYQEYLNNYKEAEKCYKKALGIDPKYAYAWNGLGNLNQDHLSNYKEAEKYYKKALGIDPKYVHTLNGLGFLYKNHLNSFKESEKCYKKALKIDPKYEHALNGLGNLYQDCFKQYEKAKELYLKILKIEPSSLVAKLNLIFLLRDKLGEIKEAREMFESLKRDGKLDDSYYLNAALFNLYDKNVGLAEKNMNKALDFIGDKLPINTQDDWWRFAAVAHIIGYDQWLLNKLEKKGYDKILSPYYVAIKSLSIDEGPKYLSSKAVEIREAAGIVLDKIRGYL